MKLRTLILAACLIFLLAACKKEVPPTSNLPDGAVPYTEQDVQFVPYTSANLEFKRLPLLDSTLSLTFVKRERTEEYFAWDQTYFTFNADPELELELRLRYLQTESESQKTLALYMPYRDATAYDSIRHNVFEMPIDPVNIQTTWFENHIVFHDTIIFNSAEWYDVYEVNELVSTDPGKDGPKNFDKIYYNTFHGIIKMDQKNGNNWVLIP